AQTRGDPTHGWVLFEVRVVLERREGRIVQRMVPRLGGGRRPEQRALLVLLRARDLVHVHPGTGARGGESSGPPGDPSIRVHRPRDRHADGNPRGVLPRVPDRRGPLVLRVLSRLLRLPAPSPAKAFIRPRAHGEDAWALRNPAVASSSMSTWTRFTPPSRSARTRPSKASRPSSARPPASILGASPWRRGRRPA